MNCRIQELENVLGLQLNQPRQAATFRSIPKALLQDRRAHEFGGWLATLNLRPSVAKRIAGARGNRCSESTM